LNKPESVPRVGEVDWGDLRRLRPISDVFGQDRGTTIRRYYIDKFLKDNRKCITGNVLEIGDATYTKKFGAADAMVDILNLRSTGQKGTLVGDLVTGEGVPKNRYNAIILTQVLHILPDMESALQNVFSALVPGGVILATIPVITQVSRFDMERWGDYWRVTDKALELLAEKNLPNCQTAVTAYGNHLTALAALTGLAAEELTGSELEFFDPDYQILIGMYSKKRK
jgi:SAM-dependent methyltransferase